MTPSTSSSSRRVLDVDEKKLKTLLNEFGSAFPLKDIASAFLEAGRNVELTRQILYRRQASNNLGQEEISEISYESSNSSGNMGSPSRNRDADFGTSKIQKTSVPVRGFSNGERPVKSDKRWVVKDSANSSSSDRVANQLDEYEDFLFKMLQHSFRVDRDVIRQVLGECGCDMKKSLEKLIDLVAKRHYLKTDLRNEGKIRDQNRNAADERTSLLPRMEIESEIEEEDCEYDILRKAVKEYRATMNEYYKSATEAYIVGDHARAAMLMEKGKLFYEKAREADELSVKRICSSSADEEEEALPLNLENCMPKEALSLLKSHLRNFSGIASIKHIRIINGAQEEDASRKASRMQLIIKLLEREAIYWSKDEDSGIILVRVAEVDPQNLSFANKY